MIQKRKKLLMAANWKMTPATELEAKKKALSFKNISKKYQKLSKDQVGLEILVCPPFPYLSSVGQIFKNSQAKIGAQDVSQFDGGSKTAEVGSTMISSIGAAYTIVGHSERRAMGDTDEIVAIKLGQVIRTGMTGILCIGEKIRDTEGEYLNIIHTQIKASLVRMNNTDFAQLVIAYEPVWAIGSVDNVALSGHELHQMIIYIRKVLRELYNDSIASSVRVLYGGSVHEGNVEDIIWNGEVDGLLIGRASFEVKSYEAICKATISPELEAHKIATRQKIRKIKKNIKASRARMSHTPLRAQMEKAQKAKSKRKKNPVTNGTKVAKTASIAKTKSKSAKNKAVSRANTSKHRSIKAKKR
jgi:triosephosphate isomerase